MSASGILSAGQYRLCVVPDGTYSLGQTYSGPTLACISLDTTRGFFSPTLVWASSTPGSYDLLALDRLAGDRIVAGDSLLALPGLIVRASVPAPSATSLVLALLGAVWLAAASVRRRRGRRAPRTGDPGG